MNLILKTTHEGIREIKSIKEEDSLKKISISGIASTFNLDKDGDIIEKTAFTSTLEDYTKKNKPIPMYYMHDYNKMIGGFKDYTVTDQGLEVKGEIYLDVQQGKEAAIFIENKVIDSFSIGFFIKKQKFTKVNNKAVRLIQELALNEISVVTNPANEEALITNIKTASKLKDLHNILSKKGFSNKEQNCFISEFKKIYSILETKGFTNREQNSFILKINEILYGRDDYIKADVDVEQHKLNNILNKLKLIQKECQKTLK